MTDNTERDKVKREAPENIRRRVRALRQRTTERGFTEAEAMAAAEMLARLEDEYFLAMEAIGEQDDIMEAEYKQGAKLGPVWRCAHAIEEYTDTKITSQRRWVPEDNKARVFIRALGLQSDTALAMYLIEMLDNLRTIEWRAYQLERINKAHWEAGTLAHLRPSFEAGMMQRIAARLYDLKRQRNARTYQSDRGERTGKELMVIRNALVEAKFKELHPKLKAHRGFAAPVHEDAVLAGRAAADTINLDRPIGHEKKRRLT